MGERRTAFRLAEQDTLRNPGGWKRTTQKRGHLPKLSQTADAVAVQSDEQRGNDSEPSGRSWAGM